MDAVIDIDSDRVSEYDGVITSIAFRYVGFGHAELDDLIQEGRISVWKALRHGRVPSKLVIERRMIGWVRFLRRLIHNDAIAYERLLPVDGWDDTESSVDWPDEANDNGLSLQEGLYEEDS